ncbi:MAG: VWA domain-containing protein [Clostridia bacterium]|nr:VWA domain-containing protein [Clostridia bacterium]
MDNDRISKQRLNVILLVDASQSMAGKRIKQVNSAITDIKKYLVELEKENSNVDFYITVIPFSTEASFYNNKEMVDVNEFEYEGIKCGGWSNLHFAYSKLAEIMHKESKGGIMPDFGGTAPIILLLTDGHPTGNAYKTEFEKLSKLEWFKAALRYGVAIELDDKKTLDVLKSFTGNNGDVIKCVDADTLKTIIKIIVITASKVKSTTSNVSVSPLQNQNVEVKQIIQEELNDAANWEW